MEPFEDDGFVAALESLRPAPAPTFAAELDQRAAAGFPRRASRAQAPLARLAARLRAVEPRRLLLPAAGTALAAVAVATVRRRDRGALEAAALRLARPSAGAGFQFEAPIPTAPYGSPAGSRLGQQLCRPRCGVRRESRPTALRPAVERPSSNSGPFAAGAQHREVERAAEIVLGTTPAEVHEVAGQVLQTVHTYRGIVLRSSIHDVGEADSSFDLLIPSAKLSDALAGFSEAGEVLSRSESSADVTARTIGLGERLQDAEAAVKGLLGQLAAAESDSEREAVEAELRSARARAAGLRSRLSALQRRVHFSRVSVRIDSKPGAVTGGSGGWGFSDALHDAGHILVIAAGVTIVGLAILAPLALIALLAWLARRTWIRRERERALE